VAFGYSEEGATNTKNLTPILEGHIGLDDLTTLHVALEHQHVTDRTTQERYYNDLIVFECLQAPDRSLSIVGEMQTREPVTGIVKRQFWMFVQGGFRIGDHTDGTLLIGNRQAGYICIGGVCRYEPEFKGVELKLFSRF
jgi:hypothetical protein